MLKRVWTYCLVLAVGTGGCGLQWDPLYHEQITEEALRTVEVAALDEALTFARFEHEGEPHVLGVTRYEDGTLEGVDLTLALSAPDMDPIALFGAHGFEPIREAVLAGSPQVAVDVEALSMPVDLRARHVSAGTNFPEHADEAGVVGGPYLFPSLKAPTGPYSSVEINEGLLDYEVELGWVTLAPVPEGTYPEHMGLILCNDYTNRDALLRHLDPSNVASGVGFTTGKSFPGYLPVGNLFVIPEDYRGFSEAVELQLYVNRSLRQRSKVDRAVWDIDAMFDETWARRDVTWEHRGQRYPLYEGGVLEDRTMLMSGTPPGVVFNEVGAESRPQRCIT